MCGGEGGEWCTKTLTTTTMIIHFYAHRETDKEADKETDRQIETEGVDRERGRESEIHGEEKEIPH